MFDLYRYLVSETASSKLLILSIEDRYEFGSVGNTYTVIIYLIRREINCTQKLISCLISPYKYNSIVPCIICHKPLKAVPVIIHLPQLRTVEIETICSLEELMELKIWFIVKQIPVKLRICIPFMPLPKLRSHKHKLLAGMRQHVRIKSPDTDKLLLILSRHLIDQRALHMHHLVM